MRASGQPASPESAHMPRIEPTLNSAMYAKRSGADGSRASTSAVNAPLPACTSRESVCPW